MAEYHVENFGCRASRADGEAIAAGLRGAGWSQAIDLKSAKIVVLNTCSVTAEADRSARAYLRRLQRVNPQIRVVVTGCYAQRAPTEVAALAGVDAVVGNSHKSRVVEAALSLIAEDVPMTAKGHPCRVSDSAFLPLGAILTTISPARAAASIWHDPDFAHSELAVLPFAADAHQTRPNLKVQDGCGNRCTFCIIPVTRGPSRSISLDECLRAVEEFLESGGKELVLSGINLGRWGRDLFPAGRFEDMVAAILERTALPRLRISSVEPMDWSPALIDLFRRYGEDYGHGPRLARHAHLPLQSGSDAILRAMHRRYRPWHYAARVEELRAALPDAAIGADVMVGFPGETEALFGETYDFVERMPFTYLHLFPFSARPGTAAAELHRAAPVHGEAVKERKAALRALISAKNEVFRRRFLASTLPVITLAGDSDQVTETLSDNFLTVSVAGQFPANRLLRLRVRGLSEGGTHRRAGFRILKPRREVRERALLR